MRKPITLALTLFALALAGCKKKEEAPMAPLPQTNTNSTASSGNLLTAPVDYLGAVGRAKQTAKRVVTAASVSQAIQLFNVQEGRFPKDLNELVAKKYLPQLPTAPAGSRFSYNPQTGDFKVVRQ